MCLIVNEWLIINCVGIIGFIFVGLLFFVVMVLCRFVKLINVVWFKILWYIIWVGNYGKFKLCLWLINCDSVLFSILGL